MSLTFAIHMPGKVFQLSAAAASIVVLLMTWGVAPGNAEGTLYAVPSHPPQETDSVGFTNSLNKGVSGLPATLSHSTELTPEQVEARARLLERGVVIRHPPAHGPAHRAKVLPTVDTSSDPGREPLLAAFLAAGALALAGLALAARRRQHGNGLRSAG